jgi:trimethylamine:corrinoid methyltransferase-like protein
MSHMREIWRPRFMDRRPYNVWEEKGDGPPDWARAEAKKILAKHQPDAPDARLSAEMGRIITAAESQPSI